MAWVVRLGGDKTVSFDELPLATFERLAATSSDLSTYGVYLSPVQAGSECLYEIVAAAAELAQVDPPERPETMGDYARLVGMLDQVTDIEDEPMTDGFPQMPDAPEIGSGSGAPGDTDGRPTSRADKKSATS